MEEFFTIKYREWVLHQQRLTPDLWINYHHLLGGSLSEEVPASPENLEDWLSGKWTLA